MIKNKTCGDNTCPWTPKIRLWFLGMIELQSPWNINVKSKVEASSPTAMTQAIFTERSFASIREIYAPALYGWVCDVLPPSHEGEWVSWREQAYACYAYIPLDAGGSSVGIAAGYGLDIRGSFLVRGKYCFLLTASRLTLGPFQPAIQWMSRALSSGVRRMRR
jgi:hypothetical protein